MMLPAAKDIENRIGITHLDDHLQMWYSLSAQAAPLRALYGSFGVWDHERKANLSAIRMMLRAKAVEAGEKKTEAQLDEEAHAAPGYIAFVSKAVEERTKLAELEAELQGVEWAIRREDALIRYAAREPV